MLKTIIDALLAAGFSQVELAERTGIPQSTISRISRGLQSDVGYSRGKKLEQLYDQLREERGE